MATYDTLYPLDDEFVANIPKAIRDKLEQLRADTDPIVAGPLVNAKKLGGYLPGNASGNVPLSNGTLNTNLNAELLGGHNSAWYTPATHIGTNGTSHAIATASLAGFMPSTHFSKVADMLATPTKYENYNVFGTIRFSGTDIVADTYNDTFEFATTSWFNFTADATNDKLTIDLAKTAGGNANHPHDSATVSSAGFMTATQVTEHNSAYSHISDNTKHFNFGQVLVGGNTLVADANQDLLTVSAGTGIALTSVLASDTFTVALALDGNGKANHSHVLVTGTNDGFMSIANLSDLTASKTHADLDHNTFGTVKVGSTLIDAGSLGATLEIIAGTGITIDPDATNDKLTINVSGTANADTLDTYHAGHGTGQIPISDGTLNTNLNADKLDGLTSGDFMRINSGSNNFNVTSGITFDVTSGRTIKAGGTNIDWGVYFNSVGMGLYDWQTNKNILAYASGTNTIASDPAWTFTVAPKAPTFQSTVATGTAPLTVASTTKVTNLNADTLDGLHDTAFVKVDGSQAMTGTLMFPATSGKGISFWNNSTNFSVYMSPATDSTFGGRISTETNSDYNMYFRMTGLNRGFSFKTDNGVVAEIDNSGTVHTEGGFRTKKFSISYNSTEDSLDFTVS